MPVAGEVSTIESVNPKVIVVVNGTKILYDSIPETWQETKEKASNVVSIKGDKIDGPIRQFLQQPVAEASPLEDSFSKLLALAAL